MRSAEAWRLPGGGEAAVSAPASRTRRLLVLPLLFITVLFALDSVVLGQGTLRVWAGALGDLAGWRLLEGRLALRLSPRASPGFDEYGQPTWAAVCADAAAGRDPGWPLAPGGPFASARELCAAVSALPSRLRVFTYPLPSRLARGGLLPLLAPYFNRGYPVEAYTLRWLSAARGPFTERSAAAATAFLLPLHPYSLRVAAFPGDGLVGVQASVAEAVELVKAASPASWAARGGCDHLLVSAHDKGGRVASAADPQLMRSGVLVVNTADTVPGGPQEVGRYTAGKDVAGICSFSTSLPAWAAQAGVCASEPPRAVLASFVGGGLGEVRRALFAHLEAQPWPQLLLVHGHLSPGAYLRAMQSSRFCLHVRGTQVQSPRLIESILLGCVPVILADSYDLPLSSVLDWDAFSLRVPQGQPQALRAAVEGADYERLRRGVCAVRRFFSWHARPQEGDAFWMTALGVQLSMDRRGCAAGWNGTREVAERA